MKVCGVDYIRLKLVHVDCVLDDGDAKDCTFADGITGKEQCKYWVDKKAVPLEDGEYCQCCGQPMKENEMSAFITLSNKQIKEAIFYHMESMRNHEVESFLLMIIQEAKLWRDLDWSVIRSKLPRERQK